MEKLLIGLNSLLGERVSPLLDGVTVLLLNTLACSYQVGKGAVYQSKLVTLPVVFPE